MRVESVVVGLVTDNNDPEDLGRVKVKFPWLDDQLTSHWARVASPMAGPDRGIFFVPEVDDEVLVAFQHGDVSHPVVIGSLWNGKDKPPMKTGDAVDGSKVRRRRIKTRHGHTMDFDDDGRILITSKSGEEILLQDDVGIHIHTPNGHSVVVTDEGLVALYSAKGKRVGVSDKTSAVQMADELGNTISIDSTGQSITIKANSSVSIQASGVLNVTGAMINLNSGGAGGGGGGIQGQPSPDRDKA